MASLSELMKNKTNSGSTADPSGSAVGTSRTLSEMMGIPTRAQREGFIP